MGGKRLRFCGGAIVGRGGGARGGSGRAHDDVLLQGRLCAGSAEAAEAAFEDCYGGRFHDAVLIADVSGPYRDRKCLETYPTNHLPTPPTLAHHVPRTRPNFPTRDSPHLVPRLRIAGPLLETSLQSVAEAEGRIGVFILALQGLRDESRAVEEQVGADLAACEGQVVEGGQVDKGGESGDDAGEGVSEM